MRDSLRRFFVSHIVAFRHISLKEVKENGIVWIGLVLSSRLIRPKTYPLEEKSIGRVDQKYTSKAWAIKKIFFWETAFPITRTLYVGCLCETFYCQDPVIPWITIVWYGHILPPNICPSAKYILSLLLLKKTKNIFIPDQRYKHRTKNEELPLLQKYLQVVPTFV